jgi:hypothetical protein
MWLVAAFLLTATTTALGACGPDVFDYTCEVTWFVGPEGDLDEVGETTVTYSALESADEATSMCDEDQAEHEERPVITSAWECSCTANE